MAIALAPGLSLTAEAAPRHTPATFDLLKPEQFYHYFREFKSQEEALLKDEPVDSWKWQEKNIPWLDVPDKSLEEIYYFRWYAFQKHIKETPRGLVISEFLDDVPWAGQYNTIGVAAEHQLREARWLRDPALANEYAHFWLSPDGEPRRYSLALADAVYLVYLANADNTLAASTLPGLVTNYEAWQATHEDANGLFWQTDDRDGMEDSIGGNGYRPTINSYMYGDAVAISRMASATGNVALARQFSSKAAVLRDQMEAILWDPTDQFYETVARPPATKNPPVRELIGYLPWYFDLPGVERSIAWQQLNDPQGFSGKYGPTTAERRSPRYRFTDPHECLWNGPSWPFATTQTLIALANLLNGPQQRIIGPSEFRNLLSAYVLSQHLRLADGRIIPWIDEDLDPDTGEWIARDILAKKMQPPPNRGRYYNHSGFADVVISGLLGIRASTGNTLRINPLVSPEQWPYFAIDGLPYHGHLLTLFYDRTGKKYMRGQGMQVLCDGVKVASNSRLTALSVNLPSS